MDQIIRVKIKEAYGVRRVYPVDHADAIEALTGQKTLSDRHLVALKILGLKVQRIDYRVEARAISDQESADGIKSVFDVYDLQTGDYLYIGTSWERAQEYAI